MARSLDGDGLFRVLHDLLDLGADARVRVALLERERLRLRVRDAQVGVCGAGVSVCSTRFCMLGKGATTVYVSKEVCVPASSQPARKAKKTKKEHSLQNKLTTLTTTKRRWFGTSAKLITWVGMNTPQLRSSVGVYACPPRNPTSSTFKTQPTHAHKTSTTRHA